jgi:hypothetical protein
MYDPTVAAEQRLSEHPALAPTLRRFSARISSFPEKRHLVQCRRQGSPDYEQIFIPSKNSKQCIALARTSLTISHPLG